MWPLSPHAQALADALASRAGRTLTHALVGFPTRMTFPAASENLEITGLAGRRHGAKLA
jgi:hypothetical protein